MLASTVDKEHTRELGIVAVKIGLLSLVPLLYASLTLRSLPSLPRALQRVRLEQLGDGRESSAEQVRSCRLRRSVITPMLHRS